MADSKPKLTLNRNDSFKGRDLHGPENSIPLSPQWLLPKPGENKLGPTAGDPPVNCIPNQGSRNEFLAKASGEESFDTEKRKDVWRSASVEAENIRREHWRDEERESTGVRRDRWREGDKDLTDHRRLDRWADNLLGKSPGEMRRLHSDRWNDTGNRETGYDVRRESKWDTRWGREDKDLENRRDKWLEPGKDGEGQREKGVPVSSDYAKDSERETDHNSRPWRSNSLQNRARGEASFLQTPTSNKSAQGFGFGRGRGDSRGRGNYTGSSLIANSSNYSHLGASPERWDVNFGNGTILKYSRAKLLDIYRIHVMKSSFSRLPDDFTEIPLLTQIEALEPLALSSPSAEEEAIIEGIERGDILNSGAPQYSKDGAHNRIRDDVVHSRRQRPGIRGDGMSTIESYKEENIGNSKVENSNYKEIDIDKNTDLSSRDSKIGEFQERQPFQDGSMDADGSKDGELLLKHRNDLRKSFNDFSQDISGSIIESVTSQSATNELQGPLYDRSVVSGNHNNHEVRTTEKVDSREVSMEWHLNEVPQNDLNRLKYESIMGSNRNLTSEGSYMEREKSGTREGNRHIPPEELSLFYKDPQGDIQGPFSGADMIGWFEAGYFGIDLPVRLQNAPVEAPFRSLADVMPHLRMKARAPPGFGTPKQGDFTDSANENKFGTLGKMQANIIGGGFELPMNEQKSKMDTLASEKSFIESLMNRSFKNPQPEPLEGGSLGFQSLSPGRTLSIGAESGLDMNYTIGQRIPPYHSVERQKSLPNCFPYTWSGGDSSSLATSSEIDTTAPKPLSQFNSLTSGAPHAMPHVNEHVDIISLLHGASDSGVSSVNKAAKSWANYGDVQTLGSIGHGGLDIPLQDQLDMHHLQRLSPVQSGFLLQHQRQQQHQPLMQHLMSPPLETNPGGVPLDQLLPSGLPQDPQTLNLFQQQQQQQLLLSQLQLRSQASIPSQVSVLDQLLILQQQQQQQQQLLPQVLLEQIAQQRLQEASYERADHHIFRQPSDPFMANVRLPQHVPSPQTPIVDNLVHLLNQQAPSKGTSSSQQVQTEENFNHNQVVPSILQQTSFRESQPSPVWGLAEQDRLAKHEASTVSLPCENVSKEQHMSLQLEKDSCKNSVLDTLLLSADNFQVASQMEQIPTDSLLLRVVDDVTSTENDVVAAEHSTTVPPEEPSFQEKPVGNETVTAKEMNVTETREVKKGTDKKKKQKNSKSLIERQKGQSEGHSRQQAKQEVENLKVVTQNLSFEENNWSDQIPVSQSSVPQILHAPMSVSFSGESQMIDRAPIDDVESQSRSQGLSSLSQRAWKPAACPKPKSLLEIQQEEQLQKSKSEKVVPEVPVLSIPIGLPTTGSGSWAGATSGSEKLLKEVQSNAAAASVLRSGSGNLDSCSSVKTKKSQLHDLLAEEVLAKTSAQISEPSGTADGEKPSALLPTYAVFLTQEVSTVDDNEFVEAKETRKNRKRGTKGKNSGVGKTTPVVSLESPLPSTPVEKNKSSRQVHQDKEVLPVPPSGPSLGDFLPWKAESSSSPPAPAWSANAKKLAKTASLRDIQKEQERKQPILVQPNQQAMSAPKVQASRSSSGNSTLWSSAKSPTPTPTPTQSIPIPSSTSRSKPEDELFWGPINQPKEIEQPEFPSLVTGKKLTPKSSMAKTPSGLSSQQISGSFFTSNKSSDFSSSSSSAKGKKQLANKHSEAKDFYSWCEAELCKLIGNNDTHFLEFCMKQSTSEAEMLLVENLGSFDPEREFIDKVLKYKELLSADVIEMAFSYRDVHVQSVRNVQNQHANTVDNKSGLDLDNTAVANDMDSSAKGGKKKGKKGRKLNPAVLGFSVESTSRIMKGEIQIVDD